MRIHCLENVDKALQFLKEQKVHLENMGSHDIVDGNHRLTLGLIWTIILRFQVIYKVAVMSSTDFPSDLSHHHVAELGLWDVRSLDLAMPRKTELLKVNIILQSNSLCHYFSYELTVGT